MNLNQINYPRLNWKHHGPAMYLLKAIWCMKIIEGDQLFTYHEPLHGPITFHCMQGFLQQSWQ